MTSSTALRYRSRRGSTFAVPIVLNKPENILMATSHKRPQTDSGLTDTTALDGSRGDNSDRHLSSGRPICVSQMALFGCVNRCVLRRAAASLRPYFSEYALIKYRVHVELRWLIAMSEHPEMAEVPALSEATRGWLESLAESMKPDDAQRVKDIERTTNHDVKVRAPEVRSSQPRHRRWSTGLKSRSQGVRPTASRPSSFLS